MASLLIPDLLFLSFLLLTALHPDIWINCRRSSPTTPLPSPNKQAKIRAGLAQSLVFRTRILWSLWLKVIIQAIQISFLFVLAPKEAILKNFSYKQEVLFLQSSSPMETWEVVGRKVIPLPLPVSFLNI